MNFIASETPQKLRGGYYTPPEIASFLARWVLEIKPRKLLEPAFGDGSFFEALADLPHSDLDSVAGCEINPEEVHKATAKARRLDVTLNLATGDFLEWAIPRLANGQDFDAVLGNPPFIRYQYLESTLQARAERIFNVFGLAFTKHTNAWVPFIIASLAMLRPGGRLAMVVPSELLHIIHARSLRKFLLQQCSQVVVIDPEDICFDDTLQGVVLLLAQKRGNGDNRDTQVAITPVQGIASLDTPAREYVKQADFFPGSVLNGKWMLGLLSRTERTLFSQLDSHPSVLAFNDVAKVDVGMVTGANKFFHVTDEVVREYGLEPWAAPMFGRSDHVKGIVYGAAEHEENRRQGLPTNFIWFDTSFSLTDSARRYIRLGESQGLHQRYKCRVRSPWYTVPSVYLTNVAMLKRCHHLPRMVLNTAKAHTTDTAYRITLKAETKPNDLVFSFMNSLTALSAELEGRHYGGGVLELVPSEIERMIIPIRRAEPADIQRLDRMVRAGTAPEEILKRQDADLLAPLGISAKDRITLLGAWDRLRMRRQRSPVVVAGDDA